MPTYDYVCSSCGHRIEVVHGVHAHGPSECPACAGPMRKVFAPPAVHFKGSGWAKKERASSAAARTKPSKGAGSPGDVAASSGSGEGEAGPGASGSGESGTADAPAPAAAPAAGVRPGGE